MTKTLTIVFLAYILAFLCSCDCKARISQAEAESAVRVFEANSLLQYDTVELKNYSMNTNYTPLHPSASREYYVLNKTTPNRRWYIHSQTGEVCVATYKDLWEDLSVEREPFGSYTQEQCRVIALAFARAKYANFDSQEFICQDIPWGSNCWGFTWTQTISPGAITPCFVSIAVNPGTGQVVRYSGEHVAIAAIVDSPITQQQAANAAFDYFQITDNQELDSPPTLYVDEQGHLYYLVLLNGNRDDETYVDASATLDAVTGEVLWHLSPGSILPAKKNTSTITKNSRNKKYSNPPVANKKKVKSTVDKKAKVVAPKVLRIDKKHRVSVKKKGDKGDKGGRHLKAPIKTGGM